MIEVNKNTLAGAFGALGKLICRTSPLALYKSIKTEAADGTLRLSTCGLNEGVSFELETDSDDEFSCLVGFDEFRDAVRSGRDKTIGLTYEAGTLLVGDRYLMTGSRMSNGRTFPREWNLQIVCCLKVWSRCLPERHRLLTGTNRE